MQRIKVATQSVVATSATMKEGRDIIKRSRHQLHRKEVTTSLSGRDISCKERRSRHHLAVAISVPKKGGRDIIKRSGYQMQRKEVATSFSGRDIESNERRS